MNFEKLITHRYSVRKYKNISISKDTLYKVLNAARLAPSAVNYQPWHFIIISNPDKLNQIHNSYKRDWFKSAPVVIVACADHSQSWKRKTDGKDFADIDVAISVDHLTLQAAELGLGTCWVCNFNSQLCSEVLQLPEHITPVAMITIGYPVNWDQPEKKRKSLTEIIHWENFTTEKQ